MALNNTFKGLKLRAFTKLNLFTDVTVYARAGRATMVSAYRRTTIADYRAWTPDYSLFYVEIPPHALIDGWLPS